MGVRRPHELRHSAAAIVSAAGLPLERVGVHDELDPFGFGDTDLEHATGSIGADGQGEGVEIRCASLPGQVCNSPGGFGAERWAHVAVDAQLDGDPCRGQSAWRQDREEPVTGDQPRTFATSLTHPSECPPQDGFVRHRRCSAVRKVSTDIKPNTRRNPRSSDLGFCGRRGVGVEGIEPPTSSVSWMIRASVDVRGCS